MQPQHSLNQCPAKPLPRTIPSQLAPIFSDGSVEGGFFLSTTQYSEARIFSVDSEELEEV